MGCILVVSYKRLRGEEGSAAFISKVRYMPLYRQLQRAAIRRFQDHLQSDRDYV